MSTSRVGRVQLRLGVPAELVERTAQLRRTAEERFVVSVLDELERRLHAKFGEHAVIRIRRLAVACHVEAAELAALEVATKLAGDLAEQIAADIAALDGAERLWPRSEKLAIFADEAHADAVYLADVAEGHAEHWLHATRTGAAATWSEAILRGSAAVAAIVQWLRRMERLEPVLALAANDVHEAVLLAVPEVASVIEIVRARVDAARAPASRRHRTPEPERTPPEADAARAPSTMTAEGSVADPSRGASERVVVDAHEGSGVRGAEPVRVLAPATVEPSTLPGEVGAAADAIVADDRITLDTTAAGLFYLVGRVLEIELAERLWAAGVPEGAVLAAVGNAVLGASNDPTARWFGGGFEGPLPLPTVEPWAMSEVTETVQHALGCRLVQFGVRMSPAELDQSLERLAREVPLTSSDGITQRLIARSVAALAMIVCARLGERPSLTRLRDVCTRPGRLVLTESELYVVLPQEAIDVDIRRAALDQDPGHAPWLRRYVRIELIAGESE